MTKGQVKIGCVLVVAGTSLAACGAATEANDGGDLSGSGGQAVAAGGTMPKGLPPHTGGSWIAGVAPSGGGSGGTDVGPVIGLPPLEAGAPSYGGDIGYGGELLLGIPK